jgi:endonuclease/exonuclease/phosphatase family metal-dependent hydrolase
MKAATKKIDYIFTKNIDVKSYRCIDDRRKNNLNLSDHFPIIIEI